MSERALPPALVALTPGDVAAERVEALLAAIERAIDGGLRGLLVREPSLSDKALLALAIAARELLGADGWLAVHDRVHLARASGADAVHVGFRSLAPRVVRGLVGARIAVGFSAHAGDAREAAEGADYAFLGPVRATPKIGADVARIGVDGFAAGARALALPAWAIGGLDAGDARALRDAGASGIAVRRGILGASDPATAARACRAAWESDR